MQAACGNVFERSDADVRALEGLAAALRRSSQAPCPILCALIEDGLRYRVDVVAGQKTGFYLDQRDNRRRVRALAAGRDVLNCFCYTGGFTVAALAGGARSVLSIDSSADALALARENVAANGLDESRGEWRDADVFAELRKLRDAARSFDLIVLDPPKFAPTASHAEKASRAYKDINLLGAQAAAPGRLARDVFLLGRCIAGAVPEDRRRGRARRRVHARSSWVAWAHRRIIRSRSSFPKATI